MRKTRSVRLAIEMSAFNSYLIPVAFNVAFPNALRKGDRNLGAMIQLLPASFSTAAFASSSDTP